MESADHPQLACPSCGHSLRGLEPVGPAQVLRCAECGEVTSIGWLAKSHVEQRRHIRRIKWALTLMFIIMVMVILLKAL